MDTLDKRFHSALASKNTKWNTPDHHQYLGWPSSVDDLVATLKTKVKEAHSLYIYPACIEYIPTLKIKGTDHSYYIMLNTLTVKESIQSIIEIRNELEGALTLSIKIAKFHF